MDQLSNLNFTGGAKATGLPAATTAGDAMEFSQTMALLQGTAWKDDVRAASTANINLTSPGANIDGVAMSAGESFLAKDQTSQIENGLYVWNGAAVAATRRADADTFAKLAAAVVGVAEGTANKGTQWRQTQTGGVLGTNNIIWTSNQGTAPSASESTAGIAEIATQAEVDAGTDDARMVTPLKLATYAGRVRKVHGTMGNGTLTQIDITHNLATTDVSIEVYVVATGATVGCDRKRTDANTVRFNFATAPANAALGYVIIG